MKTTKNSSTDEKEYNFRSDENSEELIVTTSLGGKEVPLYSVSKETELDSRKLGTPINHPMLVKHAVNHLE